MAICTSVSKITGTIADGGPLTGSVVVPAYDPLRTILFATVRANTNLAQRWLVRWTKSSTTTVAFSRGGNATEVNYILYLVRFSSGVLVQDVSRVGAGNIAFSPVNAAETFPVSLGVEKDTSSLDEAICRASLSGSGSIVDTLTYSNPGASTEPTFGMQIVTFTGANVTELNLSNVGDWSQAVGPFQAGDIAIFSSRELDVFGNYFGQNYRSYTGIPGSLLTTLSDSNGQTGDVTAYIAQFNDGTQVQHLLVSIPSGNSAVSAISPVDLNLASAYQETEHQSPYLGKNNEVGNDDSGLATATLDLSSITQVDWLRQESSANLSEFSGAVIEFSAQQQQVRVSYEDLSSCKSLRVPSIC